MSKQTLQQAVILARTGKSRDLSMAARILDHKPEGNWAETQQAMRELRGFLPLSSQRAYTWQEFVAAVYRVDHNPNAAGTYVAR
jgi:hypothetical protein